jgi:serine/threonine protein kinase
MDHPNIVKLYDVYEDAKYMHIIMEYLSGGELFDEIVKVGAYSE